MMSRQPTLSNTIHLRDFVDIVTDDPTRSNTSYVEIQTELNIFGEDQFYSPQVIVEPIRTRIHAYMKPEERELYVSDTFFYVDGRFSTALADDDTLEIIVQAFSVMRYVATRVSMETDLIITDTQVTRQTLISTVSICQNNGARW